MRTLASSVKPLTIALQLKRTLAKAVLLLQNASQTAVRALSAEIGLSASVPMYFHLLYWLLS